MSTIRTRFAPSPTGYLHVGSIRTGLYAWLLAKHSGGQFILRIEDTDKKREVAGSSEHIYKCLRKLGLNYDEGPEQPGEYGPYLQSERLDIYQRWAMKLLKSGRAYVDPYKPTEIDDLRAQAIQDHRPFLYRNHRPDKTPEWDGTKPLRFKSEPKSYRWHDAIMGQLSAGPEAIDDFVLIKSDGFPTYNFAHIIDDHEMAITHILRSHEFVASTPNYLNLYEALGMTAPILATPPPILGPGGNKKLSKRDGAKDVLDYLKEGYLVEALLNFIASLGWNDGTTQEIYSKEQLIQSFSLDRVQKSGARFDERRLLWMNGTHIRNLPLAKLYDLSADFWPTEADTADESYKHSVLGLVQDRLKILSELPALSRFFFTNLPIDPLLISNNKKLSAISHDELKKLLNQTVTTLGTSDFSLEDINARLNNLLISTNQPPAILFSLIRIATTQAPASPGLAETITLLGREIVLNRINLQLSAL